MTDQDQPNLLRAAWIADRHWKALSVHLVEEHAASLHRLDDTVFVSVSEFTRRGLRNALYSRWSSAPSLAQEAFYATGTLLTRCNGSWATDGGVTNNTPRFGDGLRPALQVSPTKAGLPMSMVVRYSLAQAIDAIELGQRDAAAWLSGQATPKPFELLADDAPRWHSSAPPATQVCS